MGGKLVSETLLLPNRGVALIAIGTCLFIGRSVFFFATEACPHSREPLAVDLNMVS